MMAYECILYNVLFYYGIQPNNKHEVCVQVIIPQLLYNMGTFLLSL